MYDIYGDWNLVIAAYNCGPWALSIKPSAGADGEKDYWKIYNYLPRETRGYAPAFIAANYTNYYCNHNICPMETSIPAHTDTVLVNKNLDFEQIADLAPSG